MTTENTNAIADGVARVRHLSHGYTMVNFPDRDSTAIMMNADRLFDFSKCRRLSRGGAHRIIDSMTDADAALKAFYHQLVDEKPQGEKA